MKPLASFLTAGIRRRWWIIRGRSTHPDEQADQDHPCRNRCQAGVDIIDCDGAFLPGDAVIDEGATNPEAEEQGRAEFEIQEG